MSGMNAPRASVMRKPHIRLYTGWYALVKYPGTGLQRDFGCYATTPMLFAVIALAAPPKLGEHA